MDLISLQQRAWHMRVTAQAMGIRAMTACLTAQRQWVRVREQWERLRLQQAMPEAHALSLEVTARIMVARNLDPYVAGVRGKGLTSAAPGDPTRGRRRPSPPSVSMKGGLP